jgi:hypothetical protein
MADSALERYLKDKQLQDTQPGKNKNIEEIKQSFQDTLTGLTKPKPPVKFFRSFLPRKTEDGSIRDTSALRFGLFLNPSLRTSASITAGEDIVKKLESEDDKDYISGLDEVRKGVESGIFDLAKGTGSLLFAGTDLALDTDFQSAFEEFMEDKEPDRPETWRGELVGLLTQFGVPGGLIQKVVNRIPKVAKVKNAISKMKGIKKPVSTVASRVVEGATIVGATDFIASEPERPSIFFEPENTEGLTGRKKAAAVFRNKIKYGAEGATVGGGFPIVGKGIALGYRYGIKPATKTTASLGAKAVDAAVFKPILYLGGTKLGGAAVTGTAKTVSGASKFVLSKAAKIVASTLDKDLIYKGKLVNQLPPFEKWRLGSVTSRYPEVRGLKRLDNVLSYLRSFGKTPKDIEGVNEAVALFVKSKARKINKTMLSLDKKAYDLAKGFEKQYNNLDQSPALQKYYLDLVEDFLRGQKTLKQLPTELQPLANDVRLEIRKTMSEFKSLLPKGKKGDDLVKELEKIEVGNVGSYLVRSFSTFTNPNYLPEKSVLDKAIDYLSKNVIKGELRKEAIRDFPKLSTANAIKESAANLAETILRTGKADGVNPLVQLKEIGKLINFKDYKIIKTGEELPTAVKNLLGKEKNLKSSVSLTISEMISAAANKRALDVIAKSGIDNNWLFATASSARNAGILNPEKITKVPRLGNVLKSDVTELYASPEFVQMFRGSGGVLDNLLSIPAYRLIMQGKVGVQIGKTLYSPQTQVRNVTSAGLFALMNGHIGGKASVTNAMKMVFDDIFGAGKQGVDEIKFNNYVERLVRLGVWDENVVASELKAIVNQIKNNQVNTTDKLFDRLVKMTPTDKVARLYAGGDNLWKGFGFEFYRSDLRSALKNMSDIKQWFKFMGQPFDDVNVVTGAKKTFDDGLDEAAAYLLRNTYPTYSKVPPSIQNLRKLPVGSFISFPAEILRTATNAISIGLKEAGHSNPAIRQMGLRRLTGASLTNFAIGTGIVSTAQYLTNSTDSQWDAYKRSGAAVWDSRSKLLPIKGWKDGESAAVNFSYFSPYDSLHAPFAAAIAKAREQDLNPQETEKYVLDLMFSEDGPVFTFLEPFITEPIGFDRFIDVTTRNGRKDQGGTVYSASDDLGAKFAKSFAYVLDGVQPGVTKSVDKVSGALGLDLTKGGAPLKLFDELLALFAGTRIIRIDVKKSLKYQAANMNRLLRAVDENEQFYNVDNYAKNTPNDMIRTFENMQEEAFRIQKDMFIRIKDFEILDLDEDQIRKILKDSGVSRKVRTNLINGIFTPVNFSKKRFETKVNTIESELNKLATEDRQFSLNEDFVYPKEELKEVIEDYKGKEFFTEEYNPETYDYKLDKDGRIVFDSEGDPVKKDRTLIDKIPPVIKEGFQKIISPFEGNITTGSLPPTPMPNNRLFTKVPTNTNLTDTEQALLSPSEQIIAKRT